MLYLEAAMLRSRVSPESHLILAGVLRDRSYRSVDREGEGVMRHEIITARVVDIRQLDETINGLIA